MQPETPYTLSITRTLNAPRNIIWQCWTQAELLKQWYCPKPWFVSQAEVDLKPGGKMNIAMQGPNGEGHQVDGSILHFIDQELLIFTDAYTEGFAPQPTSFMTGLVELSDAENGATNMKWSARHTSEEQVKQHLEMGFETGWNAATDQLEELAQSLT